MSDRPRHFRLPWLRILFGVLLIAFLWPLFSHSPRAGRRAALSFPHRLTVMTYNTHRMGMFRKPADNEVLQFLRQADADVICLQEVEVYKDKRYLTLPELREAMQAWPYTYFDFKVYNSRRQFGNVVFSRYPLTNKKTVPFDSKGSISSRCDVIVDSDTLRLIVNHLESYRLDPNDLQVDSLINAGSDRRDRLRERVHQTGATRRAQARAVKREAKESPFPVLIVGDCNVPPVSKTYNILKRGLQDCFLETGFLQYGATYRLHGFSVRIDYIFCSPALTPLSAEVLPASGSDHNPLCCTIGF